MKIPDSNNQPGRCPQYWRLYFERDAAAAKLAQVRANYPDGGAVQEDVSYAETALKWALHLQTQHLHTCPVCLEWLESLPDGEIRNDDPDPVSTPAGAVQ